MALNQDEAFHEIQLNGKQLVFLFMAATVVSVVIFLCGVLVGRNVPRDRVVDVTSATGDVSSPTPAPAASSVESAPAYTGLDRPNARDEAPKKPEQRSTKAVEPPSAVSTPPSVAAPIPEPKPTTPPVETAAPPAPATEKPLPVKEPQPSATAGSEPTDKGYAVQIAAVNARSEADAMAKRLTSKGYSAYVLAPANGTPSVYRVRVGKFQTKREAETVATKLQKEEQLKPWVTR